jgi:hypothetical protein
MWDKFKSAVRRLWRFTAEADETFYATVGYDADEVNQ